jgi:hypothetical protein
MIYSTVIKEKNVSVPELALTDKVSKIFWEYVNGRCPRRALVQIGW